METGSGPQMVLEGMLVVDMTQALAGPYLAMLLGDLGADVIKVERPDGGDMSRGWGPPFAGTESAYYMAINRNKRSFTCNYKRSEALEALRRLVDRADIVITNERRQAYRQEMGIDYESLRERNPRVVYCSITGFGMTGPQAERAGYDIIAQGMAGMMPITGVASEVPMRFPSSIADLATGMYGLSSILAALLVRERTGCGQYLDLSLLESQAMWAIVHAGAYFQTGRPPVKLGNDHQSIVPYGVFKAQDGYLIIAGGSEALWKKLVEILSLQDMLDDPRYRLNRDRVLHREEVRQRVEEALAARPVAEWLPLIDAAGIPCGPIYTVPDMLNDEHMLARGFIVEQPHPTAGTLRGLASPIRLADTPATYRLPPPLLGQHTDEVLTELGYSPEEIAQLHTVGAV